MNDTNTTPTIRDSRLSYAIERFSEMKLLYYFLTHGKLMNSIEIEICNDDEYIG